MYAFCVATLNSLPTTLFCLTFSSRGDPFRAYINPGRLKLPGVRYTFPPGVFMSPKMALKMNIARSCWNAWIDLSTPLPTARHTGLCLINVFTAFSIFSFATQVIFSTSSNVKLFTSFASSSNPTVQFATNFSSYNLFSIMNFIMPMASIPSVPGLGHIHRSDLFAISVFFGSITINFAPPNKAERISSRINPPISSI